MGRMVGRAFLLVALIIVLALGGFALWARQPEMAPIAPPAPSGFDQASIARGAVLAAMGDCALCHTAPGGEPFAGGYPVPTPFGTIYGSNITPDSETGIGRWSEAAFRRAMHEGVARNGTYLYPAFPYPHFTRVSDQDVKAIYAYLMTRPAVDNRVPPPQLPFPLNIRLVMAGWNLLYLDDRRFEPDAAKSAQWNRGAYIAEGLGHCNACHGALNPLGAEVAGRRWSGGESEGWDAPALDAASPAPLPWSADDLETYLADGFARDHGVPAGPMEGVARDLKQIPAGDLAALAAYIAALAPPRPAAAVKAARDAAERATWQPMTALAAAETGPAATGEQIFAGACASCHSAGKDQPFYRPAELALSSVVNAPDPRNFVNIVIDGIAPPPGAWGRLMPPFGTALSDAQITLLAQYVRGHFSAKPAWTEIGTTIAEARQGKGS